VKNFTDFSPGYLTEKNEFLKNFYKQVPINSKGLRHLTNRNSYQKEGAKGEKTRRLFLGMIVLLVPANALNRVNHHTVPDDAFLGFSIVLIISKLQGLVELLLRLLQHLNHVRGLLVAGQVAERCATLRQIAQPYTALEDETVAAGGGTPEREAVARIRLTQPVVLVHRVGFRPVELFTLPLDFR